MQDKEQNEADIKLCKQLEERDSAVSAKNNTLFPERRRLPLGRIVATDKISPYPPCSDQQERELKQERFRDDMRTRITAMAGAIEALQAQLDRIERGLQHV